MARMFPSEIPREVLDDPKRSAEVKVYNNLKEQLDNRYHVFYSSPWLGTYPDGSEVDGEADFLVAHPEKGMLTIEVKGGQVEIDSNDNWTSTDRHGFTRNVKNPVNQARTSKHNLLGKLKESPRWNPRFICARHGVVLPHVARPARGFRPDMPLKLFAFDVDMNYLDDWVESRFGSNEGDNGKVKPLGEDGIGALDDMLSREIKLRVRLSTNVNQDLKDIKLRTDDQIFILREMEENRRMAITGAAGTGKTILAIEKAIMLAEEEGKRVLLLCFNRALGGHLKGILTDQPLVTATHFHQYCRDVAIAADVDVERASQSNLADKLFDNFVNSGQREFDAVIIDEGQDFTDGWLKTLEGVVSDRQEGVLYIFYDDNQNVMMSSASYIQQLPMARHRLTRNFRNTKLIFNSAEHYYRGGFVRTIGPEGREPLVHEAGTEVELKARLAERVGSLVKTEGLDPGSIAILFPDSKSAKRLADRNGLRVGQYRATDAEHRIPDKIVIDTIRRFKGLESAAVFLVLDSDAIARDEVLYTGITRAQAVLEIFGPRQVLSRLNKNK